MVKKCKSKKGGKYENINNRCKWNASKRSKGKI